MDATIRHEPEPFLDQRVCFEETGLIGLAKWCLELGGRMGDAGYRVTVEDDADGGVWMRIRAYRPAAATTGSHLDVYGGC